MHFQWTIALIQLLLFAFWGFIIYAVVILIRNSNENKRTLHRLEEQLKQMNQRLEEQERTDEKKQ